MKFYHYVKKGNTVLQQGLFGFAGSPNGDLEHYLKRSGGKNKDDVIQWMESFFIGYSRGIRCFSEPIKWYPHSLRLKEMVETCDLIEIDVDRLNQDGLLEKIYINPPLSLNDAICQKQLQDIQDKHNDGFYPIALNQIPTDPVDWTVCDDATGRRFAFVPFYFLIMKKGVIPPSYLKKI